MLGLKITLSGAQESYHLRPRDQHVFPSDVLATVQTSRYFERGKYLFLTTDDYFNRPHHEKTPEYNKTGLVGLPINVILNWLMATTAGFAAFLNDKSTGCFTF